MPFVQIDHKVKYFAKKLTIVNSGTVEKEFITSGRNEASGLRRSQSYQYGRNVMPHEEQSLKFKSSKKSAVCSVHFTFGLQSACLMQN